MPIAVRAVASFDVDTSIVTEDSLAKWIVAEFGNRDTTDRILNSDQKTKAVNEIGRYRNIATLRIDQTTGGEIGLVIFERPDPGKLEVYASYGVWAGLQAVVERV